MAKKKDKTNVKQEVMAFNEIRAIEDGFKEKINTDPMFSLEIDPLNQYNFNDAEKDFISYMKEYKNFKFVSVVMMGITVEEGLELYKKYRVQQEIKRINVAMYARRFCSKMADLDALGGYLTTAITDENVATAERLSGKDKLLAVKLLIDLNKIKSDAIEHPEVIDVLAVEKEIKNLSVGSIKQLIENDNGDKFLEKKNRLIELIDPENKLTPEEVTYLRTLSIDELTNIEKEIREGFEKHAEKESKN